MVLQFNPPPIPQQENSLDKLNKTFDLINAYAQQRQQQKLALQQQQLSQEDRDIKLAQLNNEGGSNGMDTLNSIRRARGLPPLTLPTTQTPSQSPAQAPPMMPTQPEANFSSMTGEQQNVTPQGSLIISHLQSIGHPMGQLPGASMAPNGGPTPPGGKNQAPEMGSDPAIKEFLQLGSAAYQAKYGTKGMAKVKQALEIEKGLQDKTKKDTPWYDASGKHLFDTPPEGKIIPGSLSMENMTFVGNSAESGNPVLQDKQGNFYENGKPYKGKILTKNSETPTSSTRGSAEFASTIIPHIQSMRDLITEADKKGYIGPGAGRVYGQFLAGKVGSTGDPEADKLLGKLRATDSLLKTGAMRVHFGARGGQQMYDHFSELLNSGKQSAAMMNGSLDTLQEFMQGYADAGERGRRQAPGAAPETKTINGQTFVKQNGQWYHQ